MFYQDLCQTYSDVYKDFHGVRPPSGHNMSVVELLEEIDMYQKYIEEDLAQERADEDASINACMDHGAPDIDTAMRWLEQANIHAEWV